LLLYWNQRFITNLTSIGCGFYQIPATATE